MKPKLEIREIQEEFKGKSVGREMHGLMEELYPLCRSITGNGVRETLRIISRYIPLDVHEVPTGTQVFDWSIPKEWNIRDAYIKNPNGEKVVDFKNSNLHVMGYSLPIHTRLDLNALKEHLFTLPEHPGWIPYRTSYFKEQWGFCLSDEKLKALKDGEYEVYIDSSMEDGCLTYGEYFLQGSCEEEILLSCHICHPSLANDNLSGNAIAAFLGQKLSQRSLRYSYRFLFIPGTIGAIAWLSKNEKMVSRIKHGLVMACLGDPGKITYKKSRRGDAEIDRVVMHVLKHMGKQFDILEFSPYGYDERQFCSPGFNLPVGCFMRTSFGKFPEYHTSADNLSFVRPECLEESFFILLSILSFLDRNLIFMNQIMKCEPQLGKRGLYGLVGGAQSQTEMQLAFLWVLNLSDGNHSILDITEKSGIDFKRIQDAAEMLSRHGLIKECGSKRIENGRK